MDVDLLDKADGDKIELDKVLLVADGQNTTIGTPTIDGAKVLATSKGLTKGKKLIVLKFKHKDHYTKKTGHRAKYTRLVVDDIVLPGASKN